jgi:hypothetical protein
MLKEIIRESLKEKSAIEQLKTLKANLNTFNGNKILAQAQTLLKMNGFKLDKQFLYVNEYKFSLKDRITDVIKQINKILRGI